MKAKWSPFLCVVFSILLLTGKVLLGCKVHDESELAAISSQMNATSPQVRGDPFDDGFSLRVKRPSPNESWSRDNWPIAYQSRGQLISDSPTYKDLDPITMFALDQGYTDDGEVIFTWPAREEIINRDYERLAELMNEYGELVGTLLARSPQGIGEKTWGRWVRSEQHKSIREAMSKGVEPFCREVVNQLIDRFVPRGSQYRQYGNCGEGALVGACLATRSGFVENEIRICYSANDHMVAMVREEGDDPDRDWCILDRWDNTLGRFRCGVDVNEKTRVMTLNGVDQGWHDWLKDMRCAPLDVYRVRPSVVNP